MSSLMFSLSLVPREQLPLLSGFGVYNREGRMVEGTGMDASVRTTSNVWVTHLRSYLLTMVKKFELLILR